MSELIMEIIISSIRKNSSTYVETNVKGSLTRKTIRQSIWEKEKLYAIIIDNLNKDELKYVKSAISLLQNYLSDKQLITLFLSVNGSQMLKHNMIHPREEFRQLFIPVLGKLMIKVYYLLIELESELDGILTEVDSQSDVRRKKEDFIDLANEIIRNCSLGILGKATGVDATHNIYIFEDNETSFKCYCEVIIYIFQRYYDDFDELDNWTSALIGMSSSNSHSGVDKSSLSSSVSKPLQIVLSNAFTNPYLFLNTSVKSFTASLRMVSEFVKITLKEIPLDGTPLTFVDFSDNNNNSGVFSTDVGSDDYKLIFSPVNVVEFATHWVTNYLLPIIDNTFHLEEIVIVVKEIITISQHQVMTSLRSKISQHLLSKLLFLLESTDQVYFNNNSVNRYEILCWSILILRYISVTNTPNIHFITSFYSRVFKCICSVPYENIQMRIFSEFSLLLINISVDLYRFECDHSVFEEKTQSERFRDATVYHYTITPLTLFLEDEFVISKLSENSNFLLVFYIMTNKLMNVILSTLYDINVIKNNLGKSIKETSQNDYINLLELTVDSSSTTMKDSNMRNLHKKIKRISHPWSLFHFSSNIFDNVNNLIYFAKLCVKDTSDILEKIDLEELKTESKIMTSNFFVISEMSILLLKQCHWSLKRNETNDDKSFKSCRLKLMQTLIILSKKELSNYLSEANDQLIRSDLTSLSTEFSKILLDTFNDFLNSNVSLYDTSNFKLLMFYIDNADSIFSTSVITERVNQILDICNDQLKINSFTQTFKTEKSERDYYRISNILSIINSLCEKQTDNQFKIKSVVILRNFQNTFLLYSNSLMIREQVEIIISNIIRLSPNISSHCNVVTRNFKEDLSVITQQLESNLNYGDLLMYNTLLNYEENSALGLVVEDKYTIMEDRYRNVNNGADSLISLDPIIHIPKAIAENIKLESLLNVNHINATDNPMYDLIDISTRSIDLLYFAKDIIDTNIDSVLILNINNDQDELKTNIYNSLISPKDVFWDQINGSADVLTVLANTEINYIDKICNVNLKIFNSADFQIPLFSVRLVLLNDNGAEIPSACFDEFSVNKSEDIEYFKPNSMICMTFNFRILRSSSFDVKVHILYHDLNYIDTDINIFATKNKTVKETNKWTAEIECNPIHFPFSATIKSYGDSKFSTFRNFYCKKQKKTLCGIPKEIFINQWERLLFGTSHKYFIGCLIDRKDYSKDCVVLLNKISKLLSLNIIEMTKMNAGSGLYLIGMDSRVNITNDNYEFHRSNTGYYEPYIAWSCETMCGKELAIKIVLEDSNSMKTINNSDKEIKLVMYIRTDDEELMTSLNDDVKYFLFAISSGFFYLL